MTGRMRAGLGALGAAVLVSGALMVAPKGALATVEGGPYLIHRTSQASGDVTQPDNGQHQRNQDRVSTMVGLTAQERVELLGYLDAIDERYETLGMDSLTQDEWARMEELEHKALVAQYAQYLTDDELLEIQGLWDKRNALPDGETLSPEDEARLDELTDKGLGMDATNTNETYVASLTGLTDAERAELVDLLDREDAYYATLDDNLGLTDEELQRLFELQDTWQDAFVREHLTQDEYRERAELLSRFNENDDLTQAELDRLSDLNEKGYATMGDTSEEAFESNAAYTAALPGLTDAERAELARLMDKQDAYRDEHMRETGVDETVFTRIQELRDKAQRAKAKLTLSEADYERLCELWDKVAAGTTLTDEEWQTEMDLETKAGLYA